MRNLRLKLMYNGAGYHGWQIQDNAKTVQGEIEKAIERIFGNHSTVYGCSRTDAGVHANEYFCNFKTDKEIKCTDVLKAINANIPRDIAVLRCDEMQPDFHSRFDCISKEYVYKIWNSPIRNPFMDDTAFHYKYKLNEEVLNNAAKGFMGNHDFKAFCSAGSSVQSTVRTVMNAKVERFGDLILFTVEADGFLYNMVRIMVGTLININEGKIEPDSVSDIIVSGNRNNAGITAPATGLFLNKVTYNMEGV